MKRPIWNGTISFGLLNIPVVLQSAEKRVDLHFRMIDSRSNTPIRYERVNAETGEEVPWNDVVQAFEYEKGNYVILSKDDIAKVAPEGKETIEIEAFVDRQLISPMFFEKPYYLLPGKKSEKGYVLLRETLNEKNRGGIGHVIIRTRRYLCIVLAEDDMLILNLLRFHQEIVSRDEFQFPESDFKKFRISQAEIDMATKLVDSMTVPWQAEKYIDDYRERLVALVEKRIAGNKGLVQEPEEDAAEETTASNVVDFMDLLKKSLQKKGGAAPAQKSVSTDKKDEEKPKRRGTRNKSSTIPAKKSTAKKSSSKKSVGSEAASKRRRS
jgi:DNA end-binding protein Ku